MALFALVIMIPLGSLGFATGLNWAGLQVAQLMLKLGIGTADLILLMLSTTVLSLSVLGKTVLMMAQEHFDVVLKQTAGR